MKIIITTEEALDLGIWDWLCKVKGLGEWALNEGTMSPQHEFTLTEEEAIKLGLIRKGR